MICPKCGHENLEGAADCLKCGIIFSKYSAHAARKEQEEKNTHGAAAENKLAQCPDCGKMISRRAGACPACGAPQAQSAPPRPGIKLSGVSKIGLTTIALFIALGTCLSITEQKTPQKTETTQQEVKFLADVIFDGAQFMIKNNNDFDWYDVDLSVNSSGFNLGYQTHAGFVEAGTGYAAGALTFANSDGVRFNPWQMKPKNFFITGKTEKGVRGYYSATWE